MGVFKINGTSVLDCCEVVNTGDNRKKSAFFNSGKVSVTGLSDSSKTLANAPASSYANWGLYNMVGSKLKVNGTADTVAKKGTRPHLVYGSNPTDIGWVENYQTDADRSLTLAYDKSTNSIKCTHNSTFAAGWYNGCCKGGAVLENTSVLVIALSGGGGGGGGSGVGAGGGGGGGAGTVTAVLDFNAMTNNKCTITLGHAGNYGSSTSTVGNSGSAGTASYITIGSTKVVTCAAGGGGQNGKAGGGGSGGAVTLHANHTLGFHAYITCSGGKGGGRGAGANTSASAVSTPDGSYTCRTQTGGSKGGGNNGGSGGGAGGAGVRNAYGSAGADQAYPSGGNGAYDNSNNAVAGINGGGGGGAGGTPILTGRAGNRGSGGLLEVYY
jgi:hypothetical protein